MTGRLELATLRAVSSKTAAQKDRVGGDVAEPRAT